MIENFIIILMAFESREDWIGDEASEMVRKDFPFLLADTDIAGEAVSLYYQAHDGSALQLHSPVNLIEKAVWERQIALAYAKKSLFAYFLTRYAEEVKSYQSSRHGVRFSDEVHKHVVDIVADEASEFVDIMIEPLDTYKNGIEVYRKRLARIFNENRDFVEYEPWQRVD